MRGSPTEEALASSRSDVTIFLERIGEGGVSRVACIVANGLADAGLRTELATFDPGLVGKDLLSERVELVTLDSGRSQASRRKPHLTRSAVALARHLRRTRPRVLMSPGIQTNLIVALAHAIARAGRRTSLVVKITSPIAKMRHNPLKRWYQKRVYGWIFSRASAIIVLSPSRKKQLAAQYPRAAPKFAFVHNPYVTHAMTAALEQSGQSANEAGVPEILAVGRLIEVKNLPLLLRAAARLKPLPWRLTIVGTGRQEHRLKKLARELGIADRTEFPGFVADPVPYFRRARLLALPSNSEDLPAVALEAMACGCPVVATACSDSLVSIIAEAQYGRIVPIGDEAAFAEAMAAFLTDPPERRIPAAVAAYSVTNGVAEHVALVRRHLAADR